MDSWNVKIKLSNEIIETDSMPPHIFVQGSKIIPDSGIFKSGFYSASFSKNALYYLLKYQGPGIPFAKVYKTDSTGFAYLILNF